MQKMKLLLGSLVTTAVLGLVCDSDAKTVALWPLGSNTASPVMNLKCVNNSTFNLNYSYAEVDESTPDNWNLPPNPCADLVDPYMGITRYSVRSSTTDSGHNSPVVYANTCDDGATDDHKLRNLKTDGPSAQPVGIASGSFSWLDVVSVPLISGELDMQSPGMRLLLK